ncbi:MAG: hypothetical protein H7A01_07335 [Hahellaceae bacterium]|jgi:hypothetical protein|nr:hypothetical protein [Hahellaceae bacterium]MCP5211673.1 hypothetical protein [Hahellaceae bacterium]
MTDAVKLEIEAVILKLEAGEITETEAHIAIAEITTSMPEEDHTSEAVKQYMRAEIEQLEISEADKQRLRDELENDV